MKLAINDRVSIRLAERKPDSTRTRDVDVAGTVIQFDIPGQPPGVLVRLDRPINGLHTVYATRDEFRKTGSR